VDLSAILYAVVSLAGLAFLIARTAGTRLNRSASQDARTFGSPPPGEAVGPVGDGAGREPDGEEAEEGAEPVEAPGLEPVPESPVDGVLAESPPVAAAESRRSGRGWGRIRRLPPLKQAIVLAELLGRPKALDRERFP
jgi:hypothetical protein